MKKIHLVIVILFLISLTWAMYERSSKVKINKESQMLKTKYLSIVKDNNFMQDKAQSLQNKIDSLLNQKAEISKALSAKDELVSSMEMKLKNAQKVIATLQAKVKKLENIISGFQGGAVQPQTSASGE